MKIITLVALLIAVLLLVGCAKEGSAVKTPVPSPAVQDPASVDSIDNSTLEEVDTTDFGEVI